MLIMLKVSATSPDSAFCSISLLTEQSVVMNTSIVAIFGCIMPEPLAMPPILHSTPPISKLTAISLTLVSVVMMPSAASSEQSPNAAWSCGIPEAIGAMSSG